MQSASRREILIDGFSPNEILALPDERIAAWIMVGPIVFRVGSAEILGAIRLTADRLTIELAQIDGGGEGVLPTLWLVAERYARLRGARQVEWIVHALNCVRPNLKLRRMMEKRGFVVATLPDVGAAYHYLHDVA